ncbi:MAG: dihydrofolate reductase [Myxococcales bacterium]|nr:dihydrofolate reductase [Myxococcales bacterium]
MITLYIATSIDGRIAGENDDLEWLELAGSGGRGGDYGYTAFYQTVDVTVLGRGTWEVCKRFDPWPYSDRPCVVITRRDDLVAVDNETFEAFDSARWRERGKHEHVYLCGGGGVVKLFLEHDLVDRMELATIPVMLGAGPSLFLDGVPARKWRLETSEAHATGVVQSVFVRA